VLLSAVSACVAECRQRQQPAAGGGAPWPPWGLSAPNAVRDIHSALELQLQFFPALPLSKYQSFSVSQGAENQQPNVGDFQPAPPVLNCEFSVVTNTVVETINTNTQGYNEFLVSDCVFKLGQQDDCRFRMCVNDETNVSTGCMHVDEDRAWIRGHMHPAFPGLERITHRMRANERLSI
jgi:hypothetical protein